MNTVDRIELLCRLECAEERHRVAVWTAHGYADAGDEQAQASWRDIEARSRSNVEALVLQLFSTCENQAFPQHEISAMQGTEAYFEYPRELANYNLVNAALAEAWVLVDELERGYGTIH